MLEIYCGRDQGRDCGAEGTERKGKKLIGLEIDVETKHLKTCKAVRESELPASRAQKDLISKDLFFTDLGPKKYAEACLKSKYASNGNLYNSPKYILCQNLNSSSKKREKMKEIHNLGPTDCRHHQGGEGYQESRQREQKRGALFL